MRIIEQITEDEVVLVFLQTEIKSDRFRDRIIPILNDNGISTDIITSGNLNDPEQCRQRAFVLGEFRGYGVNRDMFEDFPRDIKWYYALLDGSDLSKIRYINYSYWNVLSDYTGSPVRAAETIRAGIKVYDIENTGFERAAEYLRSGGRFMPLIMLTDSTQSQFIMVEGHQRITAYAMEPQLFSDVPAIIGYCETEQLKYWSPDIVRHHSH